MDIFRKEIEKTIASAELTITYEDVYQEIESRYEAESLGQMTIDDRIEKDFFNQLLSNVDSMIIIGLSGYIRPFMKKIKAKVSYIEIYDDFFEDNFFEEIRVSRNDEILKRKDIDCFFITPRDVTLKNKFMAQITCKENCVWSIDLIEKSCLTVLGKKHDGAWDDHILLNIEKASNPIVFFGGFYSNNFAPMFLELEKKGFTPFYVVRSDFLSMTLSTIDKVYKNVYKINMYDMVYLASNFPKNTKLLMNWDSFRSNNFSGFGAICAMVYIVSLFKMIRAEKILIQYDPVSIIYNGQEYSESIIKLHGEMLSNADKIIYNSSTLEMLEYQANIYDIKKPMINFYRYNKKLEKPMPNRSLKEFHILMIGVFLDNTLDPMRSGMREYIKNILDKGVYMHYLSYVQNDYMLENFVSSLSVEQKKYFHIEKNIIDQSKMIEFVSTFNAGWMLHNTANMCHAISRLENQTYKDMLYVFLSATVTSSVLAHGCAGIPMFINRSMQGLLKEFPSQFFIPMELSETACIDTIIQRQNWEERYQFCYEHRGLFSIEDNIDRLIYFLEND